MERYSLAMHPEDVLQFWFPELSQADHATLVRQFEWWFRGGANQTIVERFASLTEHAGRGELDDWACSPRTRLALIIVLDQFSRSLYRDTLRAYAQDAKARALTLEGLANGHYAALETPGEKTFFFLPHRNLMLGRESTAEELDYLAHEQLVHTRSVPR
jgi:uncharacterized protein (DUF924 family)